MTRIALFAVLVTLWLPLAAAAQDAPRTATLSWVRLPGAEACPSTQEVARATEARLGRTVFVAAASADLALEGRIEPAGEGPGFRATIAVADASGALLGERVLDERAPECAAILPTLSMVVALLVDPEATPSLIVPDESASATEIATETAESEPPPDESAATEETARAPESAPPSDTPATDPSRHWHLELAPSIAGAFGLSPFAAPGGALTIGLVAPGFVPVLVHGAIFPWARAQPENAPPLDVLQGYAGIAICPLALRTDRFSFATCAGVDVGALVLLSGRDLVTEPERITVQGDLAVHFHVAIVGPLFFHADASLLVPFRPEPFYLRGPPTRPWFIPDPVAAVVTLGVGVDLDLGS